jgi:sugar diacid utilization regulator
MYDANELAEAKKAQDKTKEIEHSASRERDLIIGKQLVKKYEELGMEEEKQKVESSLNAEIERRNNAKNLISLDFRNPTEKMIEDAKSMGVDLSDPTTVDLLEKLQRGQSLEPVSSKESVQKNINYVRIAGFISLVFLWALLGNTFGIRHSYLQN